MRVAWLEQTGTLDFDQEKIDSLKEFGIDYYRYNWKSLDKDPMNNVLAEKGLSWSKGREVLYYEASKEGYDYYMFCDDDVIFEKGFSHGLPIVLDYLSLNRPEVLTVSSGCWQERFLIRSKHSESSALFLTDLQMQILSKNLCQKSFPVWFDGGWGTLWYPMFLANKARRGSVHFLRNLKIVNTNSNETFEYGGVENQNSQDIWNRSKRAMPVEARALSFIFRFSLIVKTLNLFYVFFVRPK
jgi:hypothetical protein